MAGKGRPVLRNKSHPWCVRVPHEINQVLVEYCERRKETTSKVILDAIKYFLGIEE